MLTYIANQSGYMLSLLSLLSERKRMSSSSNRDASPQQRRVKKRDWTVLGMKPIYLQALKESYRAKRKDLIDEDIANFSQYVNIKLMPRIAYEELATRLRVQTFEPDTLIIRDTYLAKDFEVKLLNGELYCLSEETQECIHVLFASQDPTVKAALEARGNGRRGRG
jgi:hypothetical protein